MKGKNSGLNKVKQAVEALVKLKYQLSHKQTERREGSAWVFILDVAPPQVIEMQWC